jgi:hypothetical protein
MDSLDKLPNFRESRRQDSSAISDKIDYAYLGQPTFRVYRIQWYPTPEWVALERDFGDAYNANW